MDYAIKKISFNPKNWQQLSTSGPGHWKIWRVQEGGLKQLPQSQRIKQDRQFTDHSWLDDDKMVADTQQGRLIIKEHFELMKTV